MMLAVLTFQWQLIGHINDVMKLGKSTLSFNPRYPYTLLCKMCWSKNIREERESPTQIIVPSMDPLICPLLNLAVFLELQAPSGTHLFGDRSNRSVANILDNIFSSDFFTATRHGNLGTHIIRKGAATYASQFGLPRDWVNIRGRWRGQRKQVDTYIDVNLPYPDARVASVLCGPCGPCKYATKEGHVISDAFVESVIPNIHAIFGSDISQVLVLPLLWASYEGACTVNEFTFPLIPIAMAQEIKGKWISGGGSPSDNPIEKIGLAIQQLGDQLVVVPLVHPCVGGISNNYSLPEPSNSHHTYVPMEDEAPAAGTSTAIANDSHVLFSQQFLMQQQVEDLRQEFLAAFAN